jgi:hypothetical protein
LAVERRDTHHADRQDDERNKRLDEAEAELLGRGFRVHVSAH